MVLTSDHQKNNLGLSIKFEAKSLKVIDYSRKNARYWEFSEKAVDLIREYKVGSPKLSLNGNSTNHRINFRKYSQFWITEATVSRRNRWYYMSSSLKYQI
jgi:hypothetical protein